MSAARAFLDEGVENDAEDYAAALWLHMVSLCTDGETKGSHGGSTPGKAGNIKRDFHGAHKHYMVKYFWPSDMMRPAFERRFRMPRDVFNSVLEVTVAHSEYLRKGLRPDALGRMGISPLLKVICAMYQLSYGIPADLADDLFEVSETTASLCLTEFCSAVVDGFRSEYLRQPTQEDLGRIERRFAAVGFPGCIGCLDCAGWDWRNCPKALQGAMIGKDGTPTLRMEVICDLDLWIWSFQFGLPGVLNDLNILEVSEHFSQVLNGRFPPVEPSYSIDGKVFNWFYYLTDGIYPCWKIFVKSLSTPSSRKEKLYCKLQEGVRKCVERVFGVLFRRFKLLYFACELWSVERMKTIAEAAVILHNQIVEARRDSYCSDGAGGLSANFNSDDDETDMVIESVGAMRILETMSLASEGIKVKGLHRKLVTALIEHVWSFHGSS
ncbi:unnamed protein product [Chondrus crispus]|uniref:DDE Tnp4 domain-containing protein n=1 Tax=Chondrus crispus TaxID=2769 RepID=R7Q7P4_CHOCR|nr:unnamed protein product [Chondrus crispus]CDF33411.1 unnamed protein product [Chondrus crispus]|eukprot:XP_005713214.1 unnamed protein product [Chondrus crispus]